MFFSSYVLMHITARARSIWTVGFGLVLCSCGYNIHPPLFCVLSLFVSKGRFSSTRHTGDVIDRAPKYASNPHACVFSKSTQQRKSSLLLTCFELTSSGTIWPQLVLLVQEKFSEIIVGPIHGIKFIFVFTGATKDVLYSDHKRSIFKYI